MGKHALKPKQFEAVTMRLEGMSLRQIAEKLGVAHSTIREWYLKPEVNEFYTNELKARVHQMFNKASAGLLRDMEDENPWIRSNAQRQVIDKYNSMVMGEEKQEFTVRIVGGSVDVGMPERSEDD